MTNIDSPDNQRGVVFAEQLLERVPADVAAATVTVPPNTKAVWIIAEGGEDPPPTVVGAATAISYPVYFVPFTWSDGGPGLMAVAFVSATVDSSVTVTCSPTPSSPWYIVADSGGRFVLDAAILGASGVAGLDVPDSAILVAGSDGTDLRPLLTDNTGKLQVAGAAFPAVYGPSGSAMPTDTLAVGGDSGGDLVVLQVDAGGRLIVNDLTLEPAIGDPGSAPPTDVVMAGGTDGAKVRAIRTNQQGVAYAIPTIPNVAAGDHPPNEISYVGVGLAASGVTIAAPGAGLRLRIFAITATAGSGTLFGALQNGSGGADLLQFASPGQMAVTLPGQGVPLSTNTALYFTDIAGAGSINFAVYYTTETV